MAHGLDRFATGVSIAISGATRYTATSQLLQGTGMSPETANLIDDGISIVGSGFGASSIQTGQSMATSFRAPLSSHKFGSLKQECALSHGAENANSAASLRSKLSGLQNAQASAAEIRTLPDGRIRYVSVEVPASKQGLTRGASYVTEWNPRTGQVRAWMESYNSSGTVVRVHPKMVNGQIVNSLHYPPIRSELGAR